MTTPKIKVYELAKELGQDGQHMVDVIQRLGIDIKNSMSSLGSEEVRAVRDHFRKNRAVTKSAAAVLPKNPLTTEKRVGATVIRRRASASSKAPEPVDEVVEPAFSAEAPEELASPVEVQETEEVVVETAAPEPELEQEPEEIKAKQPEPAPVQAKERKPIVHAPIVRREPSPPPIPRREPRPAQTARPAPEVRKAPVVTAPPPAPVVPKAPLAPTVVIPVEPVKRRIFPSIIKRANVEQHLSETVGPKVERVIRPKVITQVVTPGSRPRPQGTATGTGILGTTAPTGLKRVKEIEVVSPAEAAAKDAAKRKVAQGKDSVFRSTDYLKRELIHATKKRKNAINRPALKTQLTKAADHKRVVTMGENITVAALAMELGIKATALIAKLMGMGVTATMNQTVDHDTAVLVSNEFGFEVKQEVYREEDFIPAVNVEAGNLLPRPPVVTIMGHVDHGKTSLLDAIRKTKIASGEAGGITQHVGAYTVAVPKGKITFVDTPGHEAFTAMRARGAKVTDIVVLVVSAVDGVMPQTIESINHSKAANVPIIVAVNKIDLPDAAPDRIKQTLANHNLNPEEWGGDTIYVSVSAKTGVGLDALLENILLQAELLELTANYDAPARGSVIESRLDKNRGPIANILVQHGKLKTGDLVVVGATYGKVRAMTNSKGERVTEALPSEPVELLGLPIVPTVGDEVHVVSDEKTAQEVTGARIEKTKDAAASGRPRLSIEELMAAQGGTEKELRIILKSDVQGSAEALKEALTKFPSAKVKLKVLHTSTGGVTESDVMLASASGAVILGFNIRPDLKAQRLAEAEGVEIRTYTIIYELLEEVKKLAEGLLDHVVKEKVIGRAEVREVFSVPKVGVIAGSAVIDGKVIRGCYLRLLRDSRVIYEGKISSLRRFKDDVKEVAQGFECGIGLENFKDVKMGDQFEAFLKEEIKGQL